MRAIILLILTACIITACQPDKNKHAAVGLHQTKVISFSDTSKLDTFKLVSQGEDTKNMQLLFTIVAHSGKTIFKQKINVQDLLKSYLASAELKKEGDKEKFVKEEIEFFFNEEHFLEPAVTEQEQPDKNTPDLIFYKELKTSGLNGFSYRLGKDKKFYIGWSQKEQKVKIYYKCC